jgi:hypothetical protein
MKSAMTSKPLFVPWRNGLLHRNYAVGEKSAASGEYGECRRGLLQGRLSDPQSPVENESPVTPAIPEVLGSPGQRPDAKTCALVEPRFGHDFSKLRVYADTKGTESKRAVNALAHTVGHDVGFGVGQLGPGTTRQSLTPSTQQPPEIQQPPDTQQTPDDKQTADTEPIPMQNGPGKGPAITVSNGWANPAGKQDRTTVGIGELNSFVVSDVEGGGWKSADGKGKTVNSVTFQWTASAAGKNTITYTAADKSTSSVTMTTEVPSTLSGKKDSDLTFPTGTQGAGMDLTVTVSPTTVSFQALELMEGTCNASVISGYFSSHAPGPHDTNAGAGKWRQVGTDNDVSDTADSSGWPSPWSKGSYTWSIPVSWRLKGAQTSTAFSANNDQVVNITGTDGTTVVTKLGAKTDPRKP